MFRPICVVIALMLVVAVAFAADAPADGTPPAIAKPADRPASGTAPAGTAPLKIYADTFEAPTLGRVTYGYDVDSVCQNGTTACVADSDPACGNPGPSIVCGVDVDDLTPGTQGSAWAVACDPATPPAGEDCQASFWDFSAVRPGPFAHVPRTASTTTAVDLDETCSAAQCGFNQPGARLGREDKHVDRMAKYCEDLATSCIRTTDCGGIGTGKCLYAGTCGDDSTPCFDSNDCNGIGDGVCRLGTTTLSAMERENRPGDVTLWLRAASKNDASVGGLGQGESRTCYVGGGRAEVPLWRFPQQDGGGFYMAEGDAWTQDTAFACDENTYPHTCPASCGGLACPVETYACSVSVSACGGATLDLDGGQTTRVVNEGIVRLPSGHEFKALVAQNTTAFCACPSLFGCPCGSSRQPILIGIYLWEVPYLGTVVRLQSNLMACDVKAFDFLSEVDVKYGLFPPLALDVDTVSADSIQISWDPGSITEHIDRYKVYWDTVSGFGGGYAFNSETHPGQVVFGGTSATISGLDPDVEYFFTVTAVSDFTDPSSQVTTTYESLLPPALIVNDPPAVRSLPIERSATTTSTCAPSEEVANLTVGRATGGTYEFCWSAVTDCSDGYRLKGATTPEAAGNFADLIDTDQTCATLDPTGTFFLVVGKSGSAGGPEGPLGHYGQ